MLGAGPTGLAAAHALRSYFDEVSSILSHLELDAVSSHMCTVIYHQCLNVLPLGSFQDQQTPAVIVASELNQCSLICS